MNLSEIKQILSASNIRLTKSLGQNFLHDANQLNRIVTAAELQPSDRVLEIGPGLGPLTELLMARAAHVLGIEKDRRLVSFLEERFGSDQKLSVASGDALEYLQQHRVDWSDWKLVSNLPYSVASRLLVDVAQLERGPQLIVVTLQMEVAQRLLAEAGDEDYGILTLLVQLRYQPVNSFRIPASCFFPEPEIDSTCIKLVRRPDALLSLQEAAIFSKVVKRSFSQRRKMMMKLLKQDWPANTLEEAFQQLSLSVQVRAEAVTLGQFVNLSRVLAATV